MYANVDVKAQKSTTVSKTMFVNHVNEMHCNRGEGFEREFEVSMCVCVRACVCTTVHACTCVCVRACAKKLCKISNNLTVVIPLSNLCTDGMSSYGCV